jgi:hypothetical protein
VTGAPFRMRGPSKKARANTSAPTLGHGSCVSAMWPFQTSATDQIECQHFPLRKPDPVPCGKGPRAYLLPAYSRPQQCTSLSGAWQSYRQAEHGLTSSCPKRAIGWGFHEAVRGVLSHQMVISGGKIANYHPIRPRHGTALRAICTACRVPTMILRGHTYIRGNGPDNFKGIDIMRAVRSFDPCLPCGVLMYLGNGNTIETVHSPMFGVGRV